MISINIVLMMSSLFRVSGQLWYICIIEYNMCVYLPVFWCMWVCGEKGRGWEGVSIFFFQAHSIRGRGRGRGVPLLFFSRQISFLNYKYFPLFFNFYFFLFVKIFLVSLPPPPHPSETTLRACYRCVALTFLLDKTT